MNRNKKRKTYVIPLLVLLLGIGLGGIYSYWVGQVGDPQAHQEEEVIQIGAGQDIQPQLDVSKELASQGKKLVPAGKTAVSVGGAEQNVESFDVTYTVQWKESGTADVIDDQDAITRNLNVQASATIENAEAYKDLVNVSVEPSTQSITADGQAVTVNVKVTLTEPENKAAYDAIVNQNIKVNLTFSLQ